MKVSMRLLKYFFVLLALLPQVALAAKGDKKAPQPAFIHTPPKLVDLPAPGAPFSMTVRLKNVRDSERKLRIFMVKDGKVSDVLLKSARYNEMDEPTYDISAYAPVAELSYQFVLYNLDGTFTTSERFSVSRKCIPDVTLAPTEIDPAIKDDARLRDMVEQSNNLDRDDENYRRAITLLAELKELMEVAN